MTDPGPGEQQRPPEPAPPQSGWGQGSAPTSGFEIKTVAAERGPAPGIEYAELPIRIGAFIVDALILGFVYAVVSSFLVAVLVISGAWFVTWALVTILYVVGSAAYFIWSWTNLRATPGQKILNLETVSASDGRTLTMDVAVRRYLFLFGPVLASQVLSFGGGFAFPLLGYLVGLFSLGYAIWLLYTVSQSTRRQGYHDVQANTVVVRRATAAA